MDHFEIIGRYRWQSRLHWSPSPRTLEEVTSSEVSQGTRSQKTQLQRRFTVLRYEQKSKHRPQNNQRSQLYFSK